MVPWKLNLSKLIVVIFKFRDGPEQNQRNSAFVVPPVKINKILFSCLGNLVYQIRARFKAVFWTFDSADITFIVYNNTLHPTSYHIYVKRPRELSTFLWSVISKRIETEAELLCTTPYIDVYCINICMSKDIYLRSYYTHLY